ncbi:MAG: molybdenum cofactor guanylyltransferase [Desulfovibrio sp.]|nr:molybdenum cofactor guanylyltransferase [Desulfovibrio sp.]
MGYDTILGVLLGGGLSTRMGKDKRNIVLGGKTMLARSMALLSNVLPQSVLVTHEPFACSYVCLQDCSERVGPIGGIYTALEYAAKQGFKAILTMPCDLPLMEQRFLQALCGEYERWPGLGIAWQSERGFVQNLLAVYRVEGRGYFARSISLGDYRVQGVLPTDAVKYLTYTASEEKYFFNVNTKEDLQTVCAQLN